MIIFEYLYVPVLENLSTLSHLTDRSFVESNCIRGSCEPASSFTAVAGVATGVNEARKGQFRIIYGAITTSFCMLQFWITDRAVGLQLALLTKWILCRGALH